MRDARSLALTLRPTGRSEERGEDGGYCLINETASSGPVACDKQAEVVLWHEKQHGREAPDVAAMREHRGAVPRPYEPRHSYAGQPWGVGEVLGRLRRLT